MAFYGKNEKRIVAVLITVPLVFLLLTEVFGAMAEVPETQQKTPVHVSVAPATMPQAEAQYTVTIESVSVSNSPQSKSVVRTVAVKTHQSKVVHQTSSSPSAEYLGAQSLIPSPGGSPPKKVDGMPVLYPELVPICACESSNEGTKFGKPRQYENSQVIRGYSSPEDVGMCQINTNLYTAKADELGYDLFTESGNILFANWLFEQSGAGPWYKSQSCWSK